MVRAHQVLRTRRLLTREEVIERIMRRDSTASDRAHEPHDDDEGADHESWPPQQETHRLDACLGAVAPNRYSDLDWCGDRHRLSPELGASARVHPGDDEVGGKRREHIDDADHED